MLNAFADFALADLTGAEAKVWLILFRDTKAATGTARTGQADIARRAGLSSRGGSPRPGEARSEGAGSRRPPGPAERGAVGLPGASDRHRLSDIRDPVA